MAASMSPAGTTGALPRARRGDSARVAARYRSSNFTPTSCFPRIFRAKLRTPESDTVRRGSVSNFVTGRADQSPCQSLMSPGRSSFSSGSDQSERPPAGAAGDPFRRPSVRRPPAADCSGGYGAARYLLMSAPDFPAFFRLDDQSVRGTPCFGCLPTGYADIVLKTLRFIYRLNRADPKQQMTSRCISPGAPSRSDRQR